MCLLIPVSLLVTAECTVSERSTTIVFLLLLSVGSLANSFPVVGSTQQNKVEDLLLLIGK